MIYVRPSIAALLLMSACQTDVDFQPRDPPEVVPDPAPPDHGSWLSMDLAPDGQRLAMAYYDRTAGGLGFAVGTPQADGTVLWEHEQVDGYSDPSSGLDTGDRGKFASMKVAPDGTVWIAYYDVRAKDLRWARRMGGPKSWVTGLIDTGAGATTDAGQWASLALDADGNPVIAYYEAGLKVLKVARLGVQDESTPEYEWTTTEAWRGQDWSGTDAAGLPIVRSADVGRFARIHIASGIEYIAFYDAAQQQLSLLEGAPGAWNQAFVSQPGVDMGQWPSMLVDAGTLHIAYHDITNQNLMIATRGSGGFTSEVVDPGEYVGSDTELFKRGGNLSIVYFDGQNNDMKLATKSGAEWVTETLGSADHAVGFHNEVVRLGEGFWAASYDFTSRVLFTHHLPEP